MTHTGLCESQEREVALTEVRNETEALSTARWGSCKRLCSRLSRSRDRHDWDNDRHYMRKLHTDTTPAIGTHTSNDRDRHTHTHTR